MAEGGVSLNLLKLCRLSNCQHNLKNIEWISEVKYLLLGTRRNRLSTACFLHNELQCLCSNRQELTSWRRPKGLASCSLPCPHHRAALAFAQKHQNCPNLSLATCTFHSSGFTPSNCDRCEKTGKDKEFFCLQHGLTWQVWWWVRDVLVRHIHEATRDLYWLKMVLRLPLSIAMKSLNQWFDWHNWIAITITWLKPSRTPLGQCVWVNYISLPTSGRTLKETASTTHHLWRLWEQEVFKYAFKHVGPHKTLRSDSTCRN